MSCAACDSLRAKKRTCWRHPEGALQPIDLSARPGPSNGQRATLDALFPSHVTHKKWALPIVSMATNFLCDCGDRLSYVPVLNAHGTVGGVQPGWTPGPQAGKVMP